MDDPRELPDLRLRLTEFWGSPRGQAWMNTITQTDSTKNRKATTAEVATIHSGIRDGELIYIDQQLSTFVASALAPFDEYGFMPWDLPAEAGLLYFEDIHPLRHDHDGTPTPAVISFNTHPPTSEAPHGGMNVGIHAEKNMARDVLTKGSRSTAAQRYDREFPPFVLTDATSVRFGPDGDELQLGTNASDHASLHIAMLFSTCYLMRQKLPTSDTETPDRSAQRRHRKAGLEPPTVRVYRIQQRERPETTGESQREWHHRWIVRGHWRKQWYPSIQAHRPVWIAPFLKGPDDAPLLGGEKVYTVKDVPPQS